MDIGLVIRQYFWNFSGTLVYRIEVHAHLLISKINSHLHGLKLVCKFINFKEIFPLHIYDLKNNSNTSLKQLVFGIN